MSNLILFQNQLNKIIFFIYFILFLPTINAFFSGECSNKVSLLDANCYNDVIKFDHDTWRAGHACTNNNGDMIVEFSLNPGESKKRLFYGLKKNGRYYFPGEPVYKQIDDIVCQNCDDDKFKGRFESRNLFVSLNTDPGKSKQYLFSMSSFDSVVELHDIENDKYYAWNTLKFFGLKGRIFSYEYSLFEIQNNNTYVIAVVESAGFVNTNEFAKNYTLRKFQFGSFSSDAYVQLNGLMEKDKYDDREISAFRLDSKQLIVLFFLKYGIGYASLFYDDDFTYKGQMKFSDVDNIGDGWGLFNKGIHVKDNYTAFVYFTNGKNYKSLKFRFMEYENDYKFKDLMTVNFDKNDFIPFVYSNGFQKLSDERIVLFTEEDSYKKLHMFLFDFFNDYTGIKIREYNFTYTDKRFAKEISAYMYNGYILLSATLGETGEDPQNIFAIMMIFGFGNGTDSTIDISPYLMDTGFYQSSNNLYDYLISTMSIDNNIFGYERINKIRLISICNELKLYKGKKDVDMESSVMNIGDTFTANHTLLQNRDITKIEDQLYSLEYQFMVKEPDFDTLYSSAHNLINVNMNFDASQYYTPKTFDGRTNILKFKLCHRFCINCIEYGPSDNDQRCVKCKEDYTYDYLAYVKRFTGNCVPFGYMYDAEVKELKTCESDSYKYYFNVTRDNKRYCFKYDYDCPDVYHYLNTTSNECIDYNPPVPTTQPKTEKPTTIVTEKPTTIVTEKPTTIVTEKLTTIVTEKPTTIVTEKPTTIVTEKPTTIVTEKPTTIVTEKQTTIVTEKPTTIVTEKPTEKPSAIVKEKQTEKPTTIVTEKPSTIIKEIHTTILESRCIGANLLDETCRNLTNQDLYEGIKEEILSRFPPNGDSIIYKGKNDYNFQVTTAANELDHLKNASDLMVIDLGDCEQKLREAYGITGNLSLIIYKFYKDTRLAKDRELQFEVYNPYNFSRLNLSVCDSIDVYTPVDLNQDPNIYQNILDQGYDPFDLNDKFYREICTQYESENGTDVLLDAREEYYYSPIVNETSCQGNCHYSAYSLDSKYLICECDANTDGIVTLDVKHIDEKNVAYSFYSSLKLSNYKVVICYNLVFNFKVFCHNYGSIISLIFLGAYVASMIYYCFRTISPLKVEISKFLFEVEGMNNVLPMELKKYDKGKESKSSKSKKKSKKHNKSFPPKRSETNSKNNKKKKDRLNSESRDLKDNKPNTIRISENKSNDILINKKSSKITIKKKEKSDYDVHSKSNKFDIDEKNVKDKEDEKEDMEILDPDLLDNYEFNNLEYEQASEYDRRSCGRTYISVLMREELVLFTFFSCKDYNLLYVKLARFFILACTSMAFNALFFFHKTMYKKQDIEENWTFVQKLPQLLFVLVANHIIEVYLCYLSMTDSAIYKIKSLAKKPNNGKEVIDIIDCMKTKLIIFFISTFILFLGFWYFISAFCAVYQNTQKIFIRDSALSFATSLIDPFLIFGLTTILRRISLSMCCRKKAGCLYKLSDIIPIF